MSETKFISLQEFLNEKNLYSPEGGLETYKQQENILLNLIKMKTFEKKSGDLNILEIGFNTGASAEVFLKGTNENTKVISVDLNIWNTVMPAKHFLDNKYPKRHLLLCGDSRNILPTLHEVFKSKRFDLIFVDGGHDYEVVKQDMENIQSFCNKDTILVLDDVCREENNEKHYTIGPTKVWNELLEEGKVVEVGSHEMEGGRGCVWGKFLMD